MNKQERKAKMAVEFMRLYSAEPTLWTRAPGRVDLMGSHTDYNDGFILTMTIDRDTWIAARPRDDERVRLHSLNVPGGGEYDLARIEFNHQARWTNYIGGVVKIMQATGCLVCGFDALVHTTVPVASGLSSSAALEMAAARLVEQLSGQAIDPVTLARLGQRAENQFVGVNCGILDQYTSAVGRAGCALLLDARHLTSQDIPLAAGIQVIICDTRAPRNLAGTEYDERRAQCEEGVRLIRAVAPEVAALRDVSAADFEEYAALLPALVARRCRFIVEENARVQAMAQALPAGDRGALHDLFASSYTGACELYELCVPVMDAMLAAMRSAPGFIAGRQAGAGFGGCLVALVEERHAADFMHHVGPRYQQSTGVTPAIYTVSPIDGAGVLE
jgi:galactokinase